MFDSLNPEQQAAVDHTGSPLLIVAGVAGLGTWIARSPQLITLVTVAGALFLGFYGLQAARRVTRPEALDPADAGNGSLKEAIAAGGSSLRDYRQAAGELGYFQHTFRAYDREGEPCRTAGCGGTISRIVQSGRSTFFCSSCQR